MRFTAIFPFLCTLAALVLSLLCLFSGSNRGFMQNADVLTVNTSMIGHTSIFNTSDSDGDFFSDLANDIESEIQDAVNNFTSDVARAINIHDFYSAHILNYCEGYYEPNATVIPGEDTPDKNVTNCSNRTALFHFDPTKIIEQELRPGVNLSDIRWPDQIENGTRVLEAAGKAMFVLYCIGIAFTGIALIGAVVGLIASGRISALLNFFLSILAFLALGIASAITTAIAAKATNVINKYGNDIGVAAYKGTRFMAMTWVAVALMFIAACLWIAECCIGRRKKKAYVHKEGRY